MNGREDPKEPKVVMCMIKEHWYTWMKMSKTHYFVCRLNIKKKWEVHCKTYLKWDTEKIYKTGKSVTYII